MPTGRAASFPVLPPFRPNSTYLDLQGAFAQLAKDSVGAGGLDTTLRQLTATTARMLDVERVSLWGLCSESGMLECIDLYELSRNHHRRGATLCAAQCPEYFRALSRGEPIVADDALTHPSTRELADPHLLMDGISAVVHSPIHVNGELQGVLCVERVGPHSAWTSIQRLFSYAIASLVSLALVQSQLTVMADELRDARQLWRSLFAGSRDAILISDVRTGHIIDANPQAEKLFGRQIRQILGVLQSEQPAVGGTLDVRALCQLLLAAEPTTAFLAEIVNGDGQLIPVEVSGQLVELKQGGRVVQGVFRPLAFKTEDPRNQRLTKVGL